MVDYPKIGKNNHNYFGLADTVFEIIQSDQSTSSYGDDISMSPPCLYQAWLF